MVIEANVTREKVLKKERNRKIRNAIITTVIILLVAGVFRACAIATHNLNEMENKSVPVPTLNAPTIAPR